MKTEIKKLWVKTLRSGEYKQGRNRLKSQSDYDDTVRHCCLGVLCEIAIKNGVNIPTSSWRNTDTLTEWIFGADERAEFPPDEIVKWAGLECDNPMVKDQYDTSTTLSDLNDTGHSFSEIADIIEEQL